MESRGVFFKARRLLRRQYRLNDDADGTHHRALDFAHLGSRHFATKGAGFERIMWQGQDLLALRNGRVS
jgi:hypothetical protein